MSSLLVSSPSLPLINILFNCFVTSGTKSTQHNTATCMSPGRQEKNHAATCISAGRCVHKLETPDRIFHRYIVLFKTFEFIFLFVFFLFVIYIFVFNQIPHGQLHVFNVCLLFTHRITLSSTLNISRLSQQALPLF